MFILASRQVRERKISPSPYLSWEWTNPLTSVCFHSSLLQYVVFCFTSNATASSGSCFCFLCERRKQTEPPAWLAFQRNWFRLIPWSGCIFWHSDTSFFLFVLYPSLYLQCFKESGKHLRLFSHLQINIPVAQGAQTSELWANKTTSTLLNKRSHLFITGVAKNFFELKINLLHSWRNKRAEALGDRDPVRNTAD